MKYPTATGNAVLRAYNRAAKTAKKEVVLSTKKSAGFIMPKDWRPGEGYQVFVYIVRYSEEARKKRPLGGGLLA